MNTKPIEISKSEWEEISKVSYVIDCWGLEKDTSTDELANMIYGVKFKFMSGGPGYVGDLYLLKGDGSECEPPVMLIRNKTGALEVAYPTK